MSLPVDHVRWQPGMCLGSRENPDQYVLDEYIARGGEGQSWRARRIDRSGDTSAWMVKILPRQDDPEKLRTWQARWDDCAANANNLAIEGLVVPIAVVGPSPHRPGAEADTLSSYLVSRWCDGWNLRQWAGHNHDALAAADVLVRLCALVDRLHERGWVHGDISAKNVMVTRDGWVHLIDLAFLHRAGATRTAPIHTPGYVAPEKVSNLYLTTVEGERYAVGVLVREILLGVLPEPVPGGASGRFEEELKLAGYSAEAAAHAAEPLADDPARRPWKLLPWAERLRDLLRDGGRPARHRCVDLLVGGPDGLVVAAGGASGVEFLRLPGPASFLGRLPPDEGAPRGVDEVAIRYTGTGRPVVYALDLAGDLHIGEASGWRTGLVGASGLAVCRTAEGDLVGWAAHDGALFAVRCPADGGEPERHRIEQAPAVRVLAAALDTDGSTAVLVDDGNAVVCLRLPPGLSGPPSAGETVSSERADRAALAVNRWGSLEAVLGFPARPPVGVEHDGVDWDTPAPLTGPSPASDVAAVGHRDGPTLAVARPGGVLVRTGDDEWTSLRESTGTTRVAIGEGPGWRLCLAAVVDGTARLWFEKATRNGWDDRVVLI